MALDLTAKQFSLTNARELALYARMAYEEPPTFKDAKTDTQVLVRDVDGATVIAFRGTSSVRDFLTDFDCLRVKFKAPEMVSVGDGMKVDSGFQRASLAVTPGIVESLTDKPLFITGHSLGGALALLFAEWVSLMSIVRGIDRHPIAGVYTFGCPRVGNAAFQASFDGRLKDRTFNVINECDIVPRVPGWLAGYRRPGHDEFIPWIGDRIIEDAGLLTRFESDAISILSAWSARRDPTVLLQLLTDHHVDKYIDALDAVSFNQGN